MIEHVKRAIEPLLIRIKTLVAKGVLASIEDSTEVQLFKISGIEDDVLEDVERIQEYGRSSYPPVESQVIYAALNGNKDHAVILKTAYDQARPKDMEEGDNIVWDIHGNLIELTAEGIKITSNTGGEVLIKDGNISLNGDTPVARKGDTTLSDITDDPTFWTWLAAAGTTLSGLGVVAPIPTELKAKIDSGSSNVGAG